MILRNLRLIFDPLFRFAEAYAKVALSGNVNQRNVLALPVQNLLKKSMLLLVALFIFTSFTLKAQSPQKINFQSIVRNTNGVIFSNKTLGLKISILSDSITGTPVYSETHSSTTDAIGLVSLQIGSGTALSGAFATVNWGNAAHFIKLEADFNGGNTYVTLGTQELMSVPYAMYAAKTDTASLNLTNRFADKLDKSDFPSGSNANEILYWNGDNWVSLAPGTTGQSIIMSSTGLSWGCIVTNTAATPSSSPNLLVNTTLTNITIATTGATGIDTTDSDLPSGVTAVWSFNVITISGTPTAADTFNYTISLTGGCGSVNATGTITVTPAPPPSACPTTTVEDSDGNEYNTVGIGTQCWMKKNLKVTKYNNGDDIPDGTAASGWGALTSGARAEYVADGVTDYVGTYGYLYNWYAATDSRKICPEGWHVPTDAEWTTLTTYLGDNPCTQMKKEDALLWSTNTGTNSSGFSALPGGSRSIDGSFVSIKGAAIFWSATESDIDYAWRRVLLNNFGGVLRFNSFQKSLGASVRCLLTND